MSYENPTPAELYAILQLQNGDYGVEVPEWWPVPTEVKPALDMAIYEQWKRVALGKCCGHYSPTPCNGCPDD